MKVKLIAVLDSASGVYDGPVPTHNAQTAMRSFRQMAMNPESAIAKNPSDFSLWLVGEYNNATGEVTGAVKECLCYAVDILTPDEDE
jgi:hypothetical protein